MADPNLNAAIAAAEGLTASADHLAGMVRWSPAGNRGSHVEGRGDWQSTRQLLTEELEWREMPHSELPLGAAVPVARYYRATVPAGMVARTAMLRVKELTLEQLTTARVVAGAHPGKTNPRGLEVTLPWAGEFARTEEVWAMTGPEEGVEGHVLWTWYPGPITPRTEERHLAALEKAEREGFAALSAEELALIGELAVKLQKS